MTLTITRESPSSDRRQLGTVWRLDHEAGCWSTTRIVDGRRVVATLEAYSCSFEAARGRLAALELLLPDLVAECPLIEQGPLRVRSFGVTLDGAYIRLAQESAIITIELDAALTFLYGTIG